MIEIRFRTSRRIDRVVKIVLFYRYVVSLQFTCNFVREISRLKKRKCKNWPKITCLYISTNIRVKIDSFYEEELLKNYLFSISCLFVCPCVQLR